MKQIKDPIVLYLIVRKSLNMTIGKSCAQVGHGVDLLYREMIEIQEVVNMKEVKEIHAKGLYLGQSDQDIRAIYQKLCDKVSIFEAWQKNDYTKIVLGSNEVEWHKLKTELPTEDYVVVIDLGYTELSPQTETVIALFPMLKSEAPKMVKKLQLLK